MSVFVIGKYFFHSFQSENKSFVLKDLSIVFSSRFTPELILLILIYHIHIEVPLLFILFESETVLISSRWVQNKLSYLKDLLPNVSFHIKTFIKTIVKQQLLITTSGIQQQIDIMSILFIPLLNGNA